MKFSKLRKADFYYFKTSKHAVIAPSDFAGLNTRHCKRLTRQFPLLL
jgi:hypothetical protein